MSCKVLLSDPGSPAASLNELVVKLITLLVKVPARNQVLVIEPRRRSQELGNRNPRLDYQAVNKRSSYLLTHVP